MSEQTITVLNFAKYNSRRDGTKSSWYRKEHCLLFDPDWSHFSAEELHVWDTLMGMSSFKNKETYQYDVHYLSQLARVSERVFLNAVQKLIAMDCIQLAHVRLDTGPHLDRTCTTTDGRTDVTGGPTVQDPVPVVSDNLESAADLQEIWNQFSSPNQPKCRTLNKERKSAANERLKENKSRAHWVAVAQAIAKEAWCNGKNDRKWCADFEYFLRPKTHIKTSEQLELVSTRQARAPNDSDELLRVFQEKQKAMREGNVNAAKD